MSGLFAGLQLRARGFAVDIYERVDSELSGRGAGIVAQPDVPRAMRGLGIDTADLGVEMTTPKDSRRRGPHRRRGRLSADADGLGAALSHPARCLSGGALSPRRGLEGLRADRRFGGGAFERRPQRRSRSADRRRRHPLDGAPAASAGPQSALRRLCRLARAHAGAGHPARDPPRAVRIHDLLPAARRAVPRLSGGRARQRSAARPPPLQRDLVPPGRGGDRAATPAHRRERRHALRSRFRRR